MVNEELMGEIHFLNCILQEIKEEIENDKTVTEEFKEHLLSIIRKQNARN
jgi:hypothetical protein